MAGRATLAECDGLPLVPSARLPHCTDLTRWMASGFIVIDVEASRLSLTKEGRAASARRARSELARSVP